MQVELDIYSGQPNPRWALDATQSAELARRLAALPPSAAGSLPDGLGYRGLRVAPHDPAAPGERIEINAGVVQVTRVDGSVRRCADPGRTLERWLIETGRGHIDPALHRMVACEAARGPC